MTSVNCPICKERIEVGRVIWPYVVIHCQSKMDLDHNNFACWWIVRKRDEQLAREVMET